MVRSTPGSSTWNDADRWKIALPCCTATTRRVVKNDRRGSGRPRRRSGSSDRPAAGSRRAASARGAPAARSDRPRPSPDPRPGRRRRAAPSRRGSGRGRCSPRSARDRGSSSSAVSSSATAATYPPALSAQHARAPRRRTARASSVRPLVRRRARRGPAAHVRRSSSSVLLSKTTYAGTPSSRERCNRQSRSRCDDRVVGQRRLGLRRPLRRERRRTDAVEEPRRLAGAAATGGAGQRPGQRQMPPRPGDPDVEQSPFLLDLLRGGRVRDRHACRRPARPGRPRPTRGPSRNAARRASRPRPAARAARRRARRARRRTPSRPAAGSAPRTPRRDRRSPAATPSARGRRRRRSAVRRRSRPQ